MATTDGSEPALHSRAHALAVTRMNSPVLRVNPFHTSSTVSLTCSALSNTRLEKRRCFRTGNSVSKGFCSGLRGGSRNRKTLAGIASPPDPCQSAPSMTTRACLPGGTRPPISEMAVHLFGVGLGAGMRDRGPGFRSGRREHAGLSVAVVPHYARARSLPCPDP